ncbi:hypothetical protein [Acetobacterium wieringae]|uniref:hypothetical protein n=1 Tax=Acetobacterium wieringae TaxID=52694 RepID=UPI003158F64C
MIIAVLFNSDHSSLGGYYGWPIEKQILGSHILQRQNRHLKIGMGDLLFYSNNRNLSEMKQLAENTFFHYATERLNIDKINQCITNSTVFSWVIQNATEKIAGLLHESLLQFPSYLGIHSVNFSYTPHLVFYRNYIGEKYRVIGNSIKIFCPMGELEEYDVDDYRYLNEFGFTDISLEDSGAKHTIFDDYDTPEHFQQVDNFVSQTASCFPHGEEDVYELVMLLTDINPHLFNVLGSAVNAIKRIKHEEDVAQAALSGRRYLEQLADVLFEPSEKKHKDRKVRKADYKNRIWAFIDDSIADPAEVLVLGKQVDQLIDTFNAGVHGNLSGEQIIKAFADVAKLSLSLLTLQPIYAKDPYYAYKDRLFEFIQSL